MHQDFVTQNQIIKKKATITEYFVLFQNCFLESTEPSISSFIYLPVQHIVRVYNILHQILLSVDDSSLSVTMDCKYY